MKCERRRKRRTKLKRSTDRKEQQRRIPAYVRDIRLGVAQFIQKGKAAVNKQESTVSARVSKGWSRL